MVFDDDKGLVSHMDIPFQFFEYDDSFDFWKRLDLASKTLVDEEIRDAFIVSCEEKGGNKDHDGIGTFYLIGRCKWEVDCWFIYGDLIYDTDSESLMVEDTYLRLNFLVNLKCELMNNETYRER